MRWRFVGLALLAVFTVTCMTKEPLRRDPVLRTYQDTERREVFGRLLQALEDRKIPIKVRNEVTGVIETDSFDVLPHYCDCGKNFLGGDYPGIRRGVLRVSLSGVRPTTVKFRFETLLTITINNKHVLCSSFNVLEKEILESVDLQLGLKRNEAEN